MKLETISARDIDKYINMDNFLFVDLREKEDYVKGHIIGAINVDYDELMNQNISLPNNKTIILYCDRGGLSLMAAKKLRNMEYHIISVIGGIHAYKGKNTTT
jgi:rhodanese-related sulfurtransferase